MNPPAASFADELRIERHFAAPRELVWKAWSDPECGRRWAGPRGYTATQVGGDFRPGGAWRTCLRRDEDGEELWHGGVYREIKEPERLVFTFAWDGDDGRPENEMLIEIDFLEEAGGTTMHFRQTGFRSVEQRDGHGGGWSSAFDCLEEFLVRG